MKMKQIGLGNVMHKLTALFLIAAVLLVAVPAIVFCIDGDGDECRPLEPQNPSNFKEGDLVELKVNALTSIHTQIPIDYYGLPVCKNVDFPNDMFSKLNLGELLAGNKIQSSPFYIRMKEEIYCMALCSRVTLDKKDVSILRQHIKNGYHHNWIIDNVPSAYTFKTDSYERRFYSGGFPIGYIDMEGDYYINNHFNIYVDYNQYLPDVEKYRVVGLAVEPLSVKHEIQYPHDFVNCTDKAPHFDRTNISQALRVEQDAKIYYTYDVIWRESNTKWPDRWHIYLNEDHLVPDHVHWYSIINSIMFLAFLSIFILCTVVRNLRKDIAAYNAKTALADEEANVDNSKSNSDSNEVNETGWKAIHADVFRPPQNYPMLFCVCCGGGVQLALAVFLTLCCCARGLLSPVRRGSIVTGFLAFHAMTGIAGGYTSSRLYKAFKGPNRGWCTISTALLFPGIALGVFLVLKTMLYSRYYTVSASIPTVLTIAVNWSYGSIPLVFFGSYLGYKKETIEFPTATSEIARAIPEPGIWSRKWLSIVLAGFPLFAAIYVENFFIMTSLWMKRYYHANHFTLIVYILLIITCSTITIRVVYKQLCAENHQWWWFSFVAPGSTALYTFLYSISYFRNLEAGEIMTYMLYYGHMGLICLGMFLVTGSIGALSSLWFVRTVYSYVPKSD